jgi:hypothetical protein
MWIIRALSLLLLLSAGTASAQALLDLDSIDPAMLVDFLGDWSIQNGDASKSCKVALTREVTIGGLVINDVVAWRLYEDWQIVLVDATRKPLIGFSTPDNAYVADPETDGITTIVKLGGGLEN